MTLSEIITEFHSQVAAHTALVTTENDDDDLVAATYGPTLDALMDPPAARSTSDMIAALELVLENDHLDIMDEALIRAVVAGLRN